MREIRVRFHGLSVAQGIRAWREGRGKVIRGVAKEDFMNRVTHPILGPVVLVGISALVSCAHEHATPPVASATPSISTTQTTSHVTSPSGINASDEILKACRNDIDNVDTAPKFDFDKADLLPGEGQLLQSVAKCVTTGPLKGRWLRLVGRADPRGEVEYNFVLGGSRAGTVSSYLKALGVSSAKIATTSRGKLDATGTDETTWQRDRRVDIDLQ
jgi:peptidoglycan-associated lipoprotein